MSCISRIQKNKIKPFLNLFIIISLMLLPAAAAAQKRAALQLQQQVEAAITKARPACVRIWGFDTVLHQRTSGQFSGVVVKDGYLLTAAHVTIPGNTYRVMFPDGRNGIAIALGKIELAEDRTRPDVALMKMVTGGSWPAAVIGSSSHLQTGQPCISIAYPESLNLEQPTARFGIVSEPLNARGFIRSSCLMEPGDSGGPLFDLEGHLIGLHSAIEIPEKDNYDVPVDLYKKYWKSLLTPTVFHELPQADIVPDSDDQPGKPLLFPDLAAGKAFIGAINAFRNTCVLVKSRTGGQVNKVLGTVISLLGTDMERRLGPVVIIAKSSLVADSIILTADQIKMSAMVMMRDKVTDLVLLRPAQVIAGGLAFKDLGKSLLKGMKPGAFLISPQPDTAAVVSILSGIDFDLPRVTSAGFLGATAAKDSKPARLYFVRPGSPSALNGMRTGDVVTQVNGSEIDNAAAFAMAISKCWPGDTVSIRLKRDDQEISYKILLTYPPQIKYNHPAEYFAGGKSLRRDGFTHVYSNDAVLKPEQCGGPVFNVSQQFCGIQIARFSRANSLFLGATDVLNLIAEAMKTTDGDK